MICVSISDKNPVSCKQILDSVEMAEIRLDLTEFDANTIKEVFAHSTPTVATCKTEVHGLENQLEKLILAMEAGATYIDFDIETPVEYRDKLVAKAKETDTKVIVSYHDWDKTPPEEEILKTIDTCFERGADVAKIAVQVTNKDDIPMLIPLNMIEKPVIIIGMGDLGRSTRIMGPLMGGEFTFAAPDKGDVTGPGQFKYTEMKALLSELKEILRID